jgi:hypothetical protein
LTALLAAAHGRQVAAPSLRHIQRGLDKKRDGDLVLALIHLALSGTAKLEDSKEGARRLFLADALLSRGVEPTAIVQGLGLDPESHDRALDKYSPDQPRVPAGNPDGGQWTRDDWTGTPNSPTLSRPSDDKTTNAPMSTASPSVVRGDSPQAPDLTKPRNSANLAPTDESRRDKLPIVDVAYQGTYHDFLRDQFADVLRKAGNTVVTEVPLTMASDPPITAEIDILFRTLNGVVYGIEVKTGDDPSFTTAQQIVYPHVEAGGLVVSPDPRIGALGLTPSARLEHIHLVVLRTAGPGAPIELVPVLRYMQE